MAAMPMKLPTSIMSGSTVCCGSVQLVHSFDSQQVGGDAADFSSHPVEQSAELLHVGFAGGVVDGGRAFGKDGCHYDIGCSGDRCFVQ